MKTVYYEVNGKTQYQLHTPPHTLLLRVDTCNQYAGCTWHGRMWGMNFLVGEMC